MVKEEKRENGSVLVLSRKERSWYCSECSKEYAVAPSQCVCGASDKVFLEKDTMIAETARKDYMIKDNIIYEATCIAKGKLVSMLPNDRVTKNLLKRKLIEEIKSVTPKSNVIVEKK